MNIKYRVGIIGCGRIASLLEDDPLRDKPCTHAGAYSEVSETKIIAASDINNKRLSEFGKRWNIKNLYSNYREMLEKENLDIVSIAAWTRHHHEMAVAAAKSGVKGIYCEKPISINIKQAEEMLKACKQNNVKLVINHERRWDPYYRKVRNLIAEGKIGELKTIVGNVLSSSHKLQKTKLAGGGPMFHDGTHLIDILRYFAGEVESVSAYEERPDGTEYIENTVIGIIWFVDGARAFIEGGGCRNYFNFELDLQGTEGRIIIGNAIRELYIAGSSNRFTGFNELEKIKMPDPDNFDNPYINGVKDLINCIETNSESMSSGVDGKNALEIISALYKSAKNGGEKVFCKT